ncbi:hypothetical protein RIF29_03669 [Crotalaria pallida]|uniref:Protein FAR1-RELATED SEQUENCE n=1 Tax=Crotalaria pallida TaxID=3830 RepID=A0AAN9P9K4_CROPI
METFGLPCPHIFSVLVDMNITELPDDIVLDQWSMRAKEFVGLKEKSSREDYPTVVTSRYTCLMNLCRSVCARYSLFVPKFVEMKDKLIVEIERSNAIDADANIGDATCSTERVQDPSSNYSRKKSTRRCSVCHVRGHDKRSCPRLYDNEVFDDEHLDDILAQELDDDAADRTSLVDDDSDDFSSDDCNILNFDFK